MSFLPVPDAMRNDIYELAPQHFTERGIRFILLDIDNTVAPYTCGEATEPMKAWVRSMKAAGLELFILSNNRGERPERFAAALELPYRKKAWKPFPKAAKAVMAERGYAPGETAFIGDQIYTDTACAKCCGAFAVTVRPIEFNRFVLRLRYWLEFPFRLLYKRKQKRSKKKSR